MPDGRWRRSYRASATGRNTSIAREPLEFMRRFLQHTLPRHFARVRTFGWLHPAAKVRRNRVRALLRQAPVLTPAEQETWHPPADPEAVQESPLPTPAAPCGAVPLCPRCQRAMRRVGSWRAGQRLVFPNRPP